MSYITGPTWLVRVLQGWSLHRSRMARLLRRRGVDVGAYVRAFPIVEIESQLARCHACAFKGTCDRALRSTAPSRSTYSFCPNSRFVRQFKLTRAAGIV